MKRLLLFLLLISLFNQSTLADPRPSSDTRIVAYYTSWSIYGLQYFVPDIPANLLTHINYAFFNISENGECLLGDELADVNYLYPGDSETDPLHGNIHQLHLLKARYPHLKILMSIGGWTYSDRFSQIASTPERRSHFARSCVEIMQRYGFDGIDIDWEFPVSGRLGQVEDTPADKANFTLLLAAFRQELDAASATTQIPYLLTIAAPAVAPYYNNIELALIHPYLDWINLMAYSLHGLNRITNHQAALYRPPDDPDVPQASVEIAVQTYLAAGVPSDKLVIGIPFYAHIWGDVPNINNGLYQPFGSFPEGKWSVGILDQKELNMGYREDSARYWDEEAQVPWLYNPDTLIAISYEDEQSIAAKADYLKANHLGGIMIWELAYDDADHSLLRAIYTSLR